MESLAAPSAEAMTPSTNRREERGGVEVVPHHHHRHQRSEEGKKAPPWWGDVTTLCDYVDGPAAVAWEGIKFGRGPNEDVTENWYTTCISELPKRGKRESFLTPSTPIGWVYQAFPNFDSILR